MGSHQNRNHKRQASCGNYNEVDFVRDRKTGSSSFSSSTKKSHSKCKTYSILKHSKEERLGIEIAKLHKYSGLYVTKIERNSKFANTGLKEGMEIIFINDVPCPSSIQLSAKIMKDITGELSLSVISRGGTSTTSSKERKEKMIEKSNKKSPPRQHFLENTSQDCQNNSSMKKEVFMTKRHATAATRRIPQPATIEIDMRRSSTPCSQQHQSWKNDRRILGAPPLMVVEFDPNDHLKKFASYTLNHLPIEVAEDYFLSRGMGVC